jgi:hypothetical protein
VARYEAEHCIVRRVMEVSPAPTSSPSVVGGGVVECCQGQNGCNCWLRAGMLEGGCRELRAQESLAGLLVASWLVGGNVSGSGASRAGAGRELVCGNV